MSEMNDPRNLLILRLDIHKSMDVGAWGVSYSRARNGRCCYGGGCEQTIHEASEQKDRVVNK